MGGFEILRPEEPNKDPVNAESSFNFLPEERERELKRLVPDREKLAQMSEGEKTAILQKRIGEIRMGQKRSERTTIEAIQFPAEKPILTPEQEEIIKRIVPNETTRANMPPEVINYLIETETEREKGQERKEAA